MDQEQPPVPESEAVIDATFEQGPIAPPPDPDFPEPSETDNPSSPLRDYVRELGQEFQDQEEEGKL